MNENNLEVIDAELVEVVKSNELDPTKSEMIIKSFDIFLQKAKTFEKEAKLIKVVDENDIESMKKARDIRLELKDIRVNAEKARKELKEQIVREGKAIDGVANIIKALIVPIEESLEKQEKFAENLKAENEARKLDERTFQLQKFVKDISFYNLNGINDDAFEVLLLGAKKAFEEEQKAIKEAEEKRIADEKLKEEEDRKIREENEALKKEKEERLDEEKRLEEDRKIIEEENRKKLESEKEAREKAEKELADKKAEEERIKKEEEAKALKEKNEQLQKEKEARLAPEKDKLFNWSEKIKGIESPKDLSVEGMKIVKEAEMQLLLVAQSIKEGIKKL